MGIFDFLKKKEDEYDPLNVKVTDLKQGFLLDYDIKTWEVVEVYEYDWGDNFFTREFKIRCSDETRFLHVEDDDELSITLSDRIKIRTIDESLPEKIIKNEAPPKTLEYKGIKFFKDEESPGYFRNVTEGSEWVELISWDYYDEEDNHILNIEQWGEKQFEASIGQVIKEHEISNIIPASQS